MDLTPVEKAVLAQIRVLYYNGAKREHQVRALQGLWPLNHYEPYRRAFAGLVAKQLISDPSSERFSITDAGLAAMGITPPPQAQRAVGIRGALSRLGLLRS